MVQSMTGFASGQGAWGEYQWIWDIRSVNSKGLDIRQRVPDWISGLEADLKAAITKSVGRGSVSLSLRVTREASEAEIQLSADGLCATLKALAAVEKAAMDQGVSLTPPTPADILTMRGVMEQKVDDGDTSGLKTALVSDFSSLLGDFKAMRESEGAALEVVLTDQLDQIQQLVSRSEETLATRREDMDQSFRASLSRVTENTDKVDPDRIAQEIAMIAVKTDVTEEIDRLKAHVVAARKLLNQSDKIGRKLDFLSQEFNREANTLCSKSQHKDLTATGLELKAVIDQMREQVQNVE